MLVGLVSPVKSFSKGRRMTRFEVAWPGVAWPEVAWVKQASRLDISLTQCSGRALFKHSRDSKRTRTAMRTSGSSENVSS